MYTSLHGQSTVLRSTTFVFFFFNDTATTEIYTLSLHDALPICLEELGPGSLTAGGYDRTHEIRGERPWGHSVHPDAERSEEHTSELQSRLHLVCRLLLEKKKRTQDGGNTASPH